MTEAYNIIPFNELDLNNLQVEIKAGPIRLTTDGIPNLDKNGVKPHSTDDRNILIKIPLDSDLKAELDKMDNYFASEIFRKQIFGNKEYKYQYTPLIKSEQICNDDSDDNSEEII